MIMQQYIRSILTLLPLLIAPLAAQPWPAPDASSFAVRNVASINSSEDDYAASLTPNGEWLYLTSNRSGRSQIYRSSPAGSDWSAPAMVTEEMVNSRRGDGSLSLAVPALARLVKLEGALMQRANPLHVGVMTSARREGSAGDADVFMVKVSSDGASLTDVSPLSELNSSDWDAQPAIAPDGSFIVFSSTREGGLGGMDLYISMRGGDGGYGAPVNLGSSINSDGQDVSPYIAPDGRTLFFSSNGREGFGGADIFVSQRDASGAWSAARNLGERINTGANELFFTGPGRDRCYFVSDRSGGAGGLDIYEGRPNIFAPGYATLHLAIRDTVKGAAASGRAKIIETSLGQVIGEYEVGAGGADIPVLAGYNYRIEVTPQGFPASTLTLADFREETTITRNISVGTALPPPPPKPEAPMFTCTFEAKDIPMFISGYYRLNTRASLDDLRKRQRNGELSGQTYIADVANNQALYDQYRRLADEVERVVSTCGALSLEKYFPEYIAFQKSRDLNEHLEITVRAYADPRPIVGIYNEKAVTFYDESNRAYTVSPGDSLDNFKLAGLRAYYAKEYLDQVFRTEGAQESRQYTDLVNSGVIRWRPVSGGVDELGGGAGDINASRRIKVEFRRVARR
jgi:hypothetical protein